jgi:hypothetical protein
MTPSIGIVFDILLFTFSVPVNQNVFERKLLATGFILLNIVYLVLNATLSYFTIPFGSPIRIFTVLGIFQTYVFTLISFFLACDFQMRGKLLKKHGSSSSRLKWIYLLTVCVLAIVRGLKFLSIYEDLTSVLYTSAAIIPELVTTTNDFAYAFLVDTLAGQIKMINDELRRAELDIKTLEKVEEKIGKISAISSALNKFFSRRIFVTLCFNYFQLVTSFYWIFVRIVFYNLRGSDGSASILYIIQPTFCIVAIFFSVQTYLKQVKMRLFDDLKVIFNSQVKIFSTILLTKTKTTSQASRKCVSLIKTMSRSTEDFSATSLVPLKFTTLTGVG